MHIPRLLSCVLAAVVAASCTLPQPAVPTRVEPAPQPFVVAANPLAAQAGIEILRQGGSAIDAAVAVQAMLSLVEPQSSGIGGGAFITYFDSSTRSAVVYDGRETAPAQASSAMFLGPDGKPLPFRTAVTSGRATGVPGVVRLLTSVHAEHGRLPWNSLFGSAQQTARDGFIVSPRLGRLVAGDFPQTSTSDFRSYFAKPDGSLVQAGDRLRNPAYAEFLGRLAAEGPSAFYSGATAARIIEKTRSAPLGGAMTMADLAAYRPVKRIALCAPYRAYRACVPPPPSSGVGLLQLLKMLELTDIGKRGPGDPKAWYLFAEASRLMYADRDRYVGDPAFVKVPVSGLLDSTYVASRAALIGPTAGPPPLAGTPPGVVHTAGADSTAEPSGTSHFIVRDAAGNVVSMTTTVESVFGSGRMVDGFFLNNQLTDFAFDPVDDQGLPAANAVAPGKRPRSSMTPTILLDGNGRFAGAIGSAGGNAILAYVAKSLVAAIDWGLPMQQAIAQPNLVARGANFGGEVDKFPPQVVAELRKRGIDLRPGTGEDSGVHGVLIRDGRVDGGFDPRREGAVLVLPAKPR